MGFPPFQLSVLSAWSGAIPPVARQGSLLEIMQTTLPLAQPYTASHMTPSCQASASFWGIPSFPTLPPLRSGVKGGQASQGVCSQVGRVLQGPWGGWSATQG